MQLEPGEITETRFVLPADAKFLPVTELSDRLRSKIGPVPDDLSVVTRPGFRTTTRLVPKALADLIDEFREPSLITSAVFRFSRVHDQNPTSMLELSFDALATLVEARILVPEESPDALAVEPSLATGQDFAGFEIVSLVRSLEDSEVFQACQPTGGLIALKIARDDRESTANVLANEACFLDQLGGKDSPSLLTHGVEDGRTFVAMEWCDGVSVASAAQKARAAGNREQLHHLVAHVLEAYGRLHQSGVLHGDIHPGNCLIRDDNRVVILDFGNARRMSDKPPAFDMTRTGIPQFHDPLMASAMLEGSIPPAATYASEQYSVCVLAYILLTGLHPIDTVDVQDVLLRNIVERSPLPFTVRGVRAWPAVEAVIRRGLAKQPGDRYRDVARLAKNFAATAGYSDNPEPWPNQLQSKLDGALDRVRGLGSSKNGALQDAWFALRAALAFGDVELLAAADILVRRTERSWDANAVAVKIAQARSDKRSELLAIDRFLASVEHMDDSPRTLSAVLAAVDILNGTQGGRIQSERVLQWARKKFQESRCTQNSVQSADLIESPQMAYVALSLCKAGVVELTDELAPLLQKMLKTKKGSLWFWALAYEEFARQEYQTRATAAYRPKNLMKLGFALLRLHQTTGSLVWADEVRRLILSVEKEKLSDTCLPLLMVELRAPEAAIVPPWIR